MAFNRNEIDSSASDYDVNEIRENDLNSNTRGLDIKEGDLLFFPSYLPHRVGKNESDEDRIVISFNINVNHFV